MRWSEIGSQNCSVARALSVVGDRWTLLVLREAFYRTRRFEDFQARTGAPRPTEKGIDLYPVLVALLRWGDRWMADDAELPITLRHRGCGQIVQPELACPACGEFVSARAMEAVAPEPVPSV